MYNSHVTPPFSTDYIPYSAPDIDIYNPTPLLLPSIAIPLLYLILLVLLPMIGSCLSVPRSFPLHYCPSTSTLTTLQNHCFIFSANMLTFYSPFKVQKMNKESKALMKLLINVQVWLPRISLNARAMSYCITDRQWEIATRKCNSPLFCWKAGMNERNEGMKDGSGRTDTGKGRSERIKVEEERYVA